MSFVSACCNTAPVQAEYTATGETTEQNGFKYYTVGDKGASQGVVFCYDIFGFHPHAYQIADKISQAGLRVIVPDFLEGNPLTMAALSDPAVFGDFKARRATWEYNREMFKAAVSVLQNEGAANIGAVGFCWGAKLAICALGEDCGIKSVSLVHPSMMELKDFEQAQGPVLLLTSKDDPELNDEFALVKAKPFGKLSYQERFNDRIHGFCAARGDFADPEVARDVNRVVQLTAGFFKESLA
ncbi:hypothetical protein IWW50_001367 [Coemansia erecta]|nr:hypothetical protein GGF43_000896 [Coemansia sp. RSA 2618]KAJ2828486.1 hypothetical protein IWW50_001367 [Coemansia erecta]